MKRERRGGARPYWTADDDQALRDGFDNLTLSDLCRTLGRSPNAVGARCATLGIDAHGATPAVALHKAWFGGVQ